MIEKNSADRIGAEMICDIMDNQSSGELYSDAGNLEVASR